jgi:hypothetical protein
MVDKNVLALFSLSVYEESAENRILPPNGWVLREDLSDVEPIGGTGFAVDVYQSSAGEFVIAFRGTDEEDVIESYAGEADWYNNVQAASGVRSRQIEQALEARLGQ